MALEQYQPEGFEYEGTGIRVYADVTAKFTSMRQVKKLLRELEARKREIKKEKKVVPNTTKP